MTIPAGAGRVLRIVTAAAAAASVAHVGVLIPRYILTDPAIPLSMRIFVGSIVVTVLAAVAGSLLALTLVARSWGRPGARALALFLAAVSTLWGSILRLIDVQAAADSVQIQLQASSSLEVFVLSSAVIIASAAFLRFSALFPGPLPATALPPGRRFPVLRRARLALLRPRTVWLIAAAAIAVAAVYGPVAGRLIALIMTGTLDVESVLATDAAVRRVWLAGLVGVATVTMFILPLTAMIVGMRNLGAGYRVAATEERRSLLWLVAGTSIAGWMILVPLIAIPFTIIASLSPDWLAYVAGLLLVFAPAVLVGSVAVAIFYSGAVDPALVLQRSTIYGILGVMAFVLFTALESLLSNVFVASLGMPGLVGSILAGCVAAGVLVPLRRALSKMSNRAKTTPS
jgi:hypothetical protein